MDIKLDPHEEILGEIVASLECAPLNIVLASPVSARQPINPHYGDAKLPRQISIALICEVALNKLSVAGCLFGDQAACWFGGQGSILVKRHQDTLHDVKQGVTWYGLVAIQGRILITLNRKHFIGLHNQNSAHAGIVVRTFDADSAALAARIHAALNAQPDMAGKLVRVNRPQ